MVAWDGQVSPCVALMHAYPCYVLGREKQMRRYTLGDVNQEAIAAIWQKQEYQSFRKKVRDFDFAPCTLCSGCEYTDTNEEDCYGNVFPVCGDCLWAQGIIQCPQL